MIPSAGQAARPTSQARLPGLPWSEQAARERSQAWLPGLRQEPETRNRVSGFPSAVRQHAPKSTSRNEEPETSRFPLPKRKRRGRMTISNCENEVGSANFGGGGGIRTHGTVTRTAVFKFGNRRFPKLTKTLIQQSFKGISGQVRPKEFTTTYQLARIQNGYIFGGQWRSAGLGLLRSNIRFAGAGAGDEEKNFQEFASRSSAAECGKGFSDLNIYLGLPSMIRMRGLLAPGGRVERPI